VTLFATGVAAEIHADFPEWQAYSREEKADDGRTYLLVSVPAPADGNTAHGLMTSTDNEVVTVSFDFYHSHFDQWSVREAGYEHEAALPFVRALLSEEVGAASWWNGKQWVGSCQARAGEPVEMPIAKDYTHVRVRSWRGKLNADRDA